MGNLSYQSNNQNTKKMKNSFLKITCFALTAAALMAAPALCRADDATNAPAAAAPAAKKHANLPFKGKVVLVDTTAMTFTIGTNTIAISSTTKITKDGQPGVFADITVGATVKGSYKKDAEGKNTATSVKIGEAKKAAEPAANPPAAQ
jgi:hypothetical protein